jgi:nicotinate-nucleotide adenylyltransferase
LARTAVLGGSFNPIHYGHLLLADEALEQLGLDHVIFVPAGAPPHKPVTSLAPAADRYAMVKLATESQPKFSVSDIELRRAGPSYTVDTLESLRAGGDELVLILGSETFLDLISWRAPRRIAELARIVVVPRAGSAFDPDGAAAQKVLGVIGLTRFAPVDGAHLPTAAVMILHATSLPISASDLRRRAREGRSLAYRVPSAIIHYIDSHRLYRGEAT